MAKTVVSQARHRSGELRSCMIIRPPAGYATGNKPNITAGLYLLPQALPALAMLIERQGITPVVVDLEASGASLSDFIGTLDNVAPDIVFITTSTPSFCYAKAISKAVRTQKPDLMVVLRGMIPSFF